MLQKEDGLIWKEDRIVYIEGRIYIPNNKKTREKILKESHDSVDVRYPEQQRMLELIKQNYWWLGLKEDVRKYVQECFKCQQNKVSTSEESRRATPIGNFSRTMARN